MARQDEVDPAPTAVRLRRSAEARVGAEDPAPEPPASETDRLVHELQVHQVELELQNQELRRVQDELEASRNRYWALYDRAPVGYLTLDRSGTILEANLTAAALLGVTRGRLLGTTLARFVTPAGIRAFTAHLREAFVEGSKASCDIQLERPDRTYFPAHLDSVADPDSKGPDGVPTRFYTAVVGLTELRRAERALAESEARFRQIADHVEDLFYVRELDGRVAYASPAFERIWGRPVSEILGRPGAWMETIHPEDRARMAEAWRRLQEGTNINETYRIRRPDGTVRWVQSRGFTVEGLGSGPARNVGVVRDVTGERKLEEDLRHAQKMEAVGTLAGGVAHNLRNTLQAMMNFIQLAKLTGQHDGMRDQVGAFLDRALGTGRRGATLIDQLMTFAHKRDAAASDPKPIKLDAVVEESEALVKPLIGDDIDLEVATAAPEAVILADPVQIEQILLNLAANARDAMPTGGRLRITTEEAFLDDETAERHGISRGPHVKLVVRDTGSGMDGATKARIFEPFFTTKEVGKGTGLGLSTVFALVRQFGGCIEVDSEVSKGTAFTLCFPSLQSFDRQAVSADPAAAQQAAPP